MINASVDTRHYRVTVGRLFRSRKEVKGGETDQKKVVKKKSKDQGSSKRMRKASM